MILLLLALFQQPHDPFLGRWEGTSTCIKAAWNAACHDEVVRYDVERAAGDSVTLHAFKRLGAEWDPMGDITFAYDSSGHRWVGEFANARIHVAWRFAVNANALTGDVVVFPDLRKARDVVAHRVSPQ
ncbi:MAG TPA: hypothetical protein VFI13_08165 [Gemmatimonadales bacterium]|nr:hypothetical protein [Gemmatimonadales bacterium]